MQFFCINSSAYDDLSQISDVLASPTSNDFGELGSTYSQSSIQTPSAAPVYEHPCAPLVKILSTGTFYFAARSQWDIGSRVSLRSGLSNNSMDQKDDRFIWNDYIIQPLLDFRGDLDQLEQTELDSCQFIVSTPFKFWSSLLKHFFSYSLFKASWAYLIYRSQPLHLTEPQTLPLSLSYLVWVGNVPVPDSTPEAWTTMDIAQILLRSDASSNSGLCVLTNGY